MLGLGIPTWVYGLTIGLFLGYWVSRYKPVKYCSECDAVLHSYVEYCPEHGHSTEEREIRVIHSIFFDVVNWFAGTFDWDYLHRPRQNSDYFDAYDEIGTGVFYDRGEDSTEERYVLGLDGINLYFDVVGTKEDKFLEPPEVHGTIYGLEYLKEDGDSE